MVSETFKNACAAFLQNHHSLEGPLPDFGIDQRPIAERFELHSRPCLKHHARDDFNADKFNAMEPAIPQIVVQNWPQLHLPRSMHRFASNSLPCTQA